MEGAGAGVEPLSDANFCFAGNKLVYFFLFYRSAMIRLIATTTCSHMTDTTAGGNVP